MQRQKLILVIPGEEDVFCIEPMDQSATWFLVIWNFVVDFNTPLLTAPTLGRKKSWIANCGMQSNG